MGSKRKISGEASEPVVVAVATASVARTDQSQRGMMAGMRLRLQARRQVLQQMAPQYRIADGKHKSELLEAFVQVTGYHRKYAMWLLTAVFSKIELFLHTTCMPVLVSVTIRNDCLNHPKWRNTR